MAISLLNAGPTTEVAEPTDLRYGFAAPPVSLSTTTETDDTAAVTLQDRAVNAVTLGSGVTTCTFTFPPKVRGVARDFFVRLTLTGSDLPTLYFKEQGGASVAFDVDDDSWAEIEQGVNVLMFSDTSEASA